MKTIIDQIKTLDKQTAKDLGAVAEMSYEYIRQLEEGNEERAEELFKIIDMIKETTKNRVREIAEKELETI